MSTVCPMLVTRMPRPQEMSLLMRGKLLTRGRTLIGNLWKKMTLRWSLWRRTILRRDLARVERK